MSDNLSFGNETNSDMDEYCMINTATNNSCIANNQSCINYYGSKFSIINCYCTSFQFLYFNERFSINFGFYFTFNVDYCIFRLFNNVRYFWVDSIFKL